MSLVYVILINIILIFIFSVVLNHKINKNSTSALLDKYAKDVEDLIVELNRTVDDLLDLSEERVEELKKLIKKAEKLLKNREVRSALAAGQGAEEAGTVGRRERAPASPMPQASEVPLVSPLSPVSKDASAPKNLMEKTGHLLAMGHSKKEIAGILKINLAEVEFLQSLLGKR
jgi:hypothetical protein